MYFMVADINDFMYYFRCRYYSIDITHNPTISFKDIYIGMQANTTKYNNHIYIYLHTFAVDLFRLGTRS